MVENGSKWIDLGVAGVSQVFLRHPNKTLRGHDRGVIGGWIKMRSKKAALTAALQKELHSTIQRYLLIRSSVR